MKKQNWFFLIKRKKDDGLTPAERMFKRCPAAILEDMRASEEELDQLEKMIAEARQRISKSINNQ